MNAAAARLVYRDGHCFNLRGWCVVKIIVLSCAAGVRGFGIHDDIPDTLAES
jgi:hypothetical protein